MTAPDANRLSPRTILRRALSLRHDAQRVADQTEDVRVRAMRAYAHLRADRVREELAGIPVARLRDATEGRLRVTPLEEAGLKTVYDVYSRSAAELDRMPGVGEASARLAIAAAHQVASAVSSSVRVRIDPADAGARGDEHGTEFVRVLNQLVEADRLAPGVRDRAYRFQMEVETLLPAALPARSRLRMLFTRRKRREAAVAAAERLGRLVLWAESIGLEQGLDKVHKRLDRRPARAKKAWADFEAKSPEYYSVLDSFLGRGSDVASSESHLPADILARVREQPLDDRYRRVALRGYQSFGARFALAQRRVILGDEMGLGKTIQAIAVMSHLRAGQHLHFLVVCPASVLINWVREVGERSHLTVYRMHGADRAIVAKTWVRDGGVAVTTVDSLHDLDVPSGVPIALLVVDEAHYVKNPRTRRSKAVGAWAKRAERVLFLTGTPMENRVDEFRSLVGYLQPHLVPRIAGHDAVAGADAFRSAVAPVYLRRNQEEVLGELPELVRSDDWLEMTRADESHYRAAVSAGNFMAMRRAAYKAAPADSAKLSRLMEIVEEAAENGRKVVVFSFFRDVLDAVGKALATVTVPPPGAGQRLKRGQVPPPGRPVPVYGPLTGATPPDARQALVDEFSAASGAAVLTSQIIAGGVGLNIQAASVIVICEPQVKPTIEEQAIARSHRMGQVRSVAVHRLITSDSVDDRMLELLREKSALFDAFARQSDLAEAGADAVDIGEADLARRVVAMERERLGA